MKISIGTGRWKGSCNDNVIEWQYNFTVEKVYEMFFEIVYILQLYFSRNCKLLLCSINEEGCWCFIKLFHSSRNRIQIRWMLLKRRLFSQKHFKLGVLLANTYFVNDSTKKSIQNFVHFIYIYPETKSLKNLQNGFTISLVANKIFYNG